MQSFPRPAERFGEDDQGVPTVTQSFQNSLFSVAATIVFGGLALLAALPIVPVA